MRFRLFHPFILKMINLASRTSKLYLGTQKKWSLNLVSFCLQIANKKKVSRVHDLFGDQNSMDTAGLKKHENATFLT